MKIAVLGLKKCIKCIVHTRGLLDDVSDHFVKSADVTQICAGLVESVRSQFSQILLDAREEAALARDFVAKLKAAVPPALPNYQEIMEALDEALNNKIKEIKTEHRSRANVASGIAAGEVEVLQGRLLSSSDFDHAVPKSQTATKPPTGTSQVSGLNFFSNQDIPLKPVHGSSNDLPPVGGERIDATTTSDYASKFICS